MCFLKRRPPRPNRPFSKPQKPMDQSLASSNYSTSSGATSSTFSAVSTSSANSLAGIKDSLAAGPIMYGFREILSATDGFKCQKLGDSIWKGMLRKTTVAIVKKEGSVPDFRYVLKCVGTVHHSNIVKLLGGCQEGDHVYLAYEFVEGANLRHLIRSPTVDTYSALSTWKSRIQIALDIAQGLEYLHHHTDFGFVHKYIQSTKIMVNSQFRAKIAHFGVAELTGEVQSGAVGTGFSSKIDESGEIEGRSQRRLVRSSSIRIVGSPGYMAPEYSTSGIITLKYDVFAFGVILLELLSGRDAMFTATGSSTLSKKATLPELINSVMDGPDSKAKLRQWIDPLLKDSYPLEDAYKVAALAKSCVDLDPVKRPEMSSVSLKLSRYLASSEKWEANIGAGRSMMSMSLQPR